MATKRALITGITGQDGSYLAEFLLAKGYEVVGVVRRSSTVNFERIAHIQDRLHARARRSPRPGLVDQRHRRARAGGGLQPRGAELRDDELLATGAHGRRHRARRDVRLLEAIRHVDPDIRFYQASSSEMFGKVIEVPQTERTPFYPRSPYGAAKAYAHWITVNYRESYDLFAAAASCSTTVRRGAGSSSSNAR